MCSRVSQQYAAECHSNVQPSETACLLCKAQVCKLPTGERMSYSVVEPVRFRDRNIENWNADYSWFDVKE
ncbi:hypothetical protein BaRGS_00038870, partial [Batillaria attramentaria]